MDLPSTVADIPRVLCSVLALCGGVFMAIDLVKFHRMIQSSKRESYFKHPTNIVLENIAFVFMVLFAIGYVVGTIDLFFRDVEFIYMFVAVIFAMASAFFFLILDILEKLLNSVRDKTTELMNSYVNSIEMKDPYTKGHSKHVTRLVEIFFSHLPAHYASRLNLPKLLDAALLHDIGKISVSDSILNKTSAPTKEEWEIIKTHPLNGKKMLEGTCFEEIGDWVMYHHERMDGKGYHSLAADKIPLESRIIAIADTFSALATDRAYRNRMDFRNILEIMNEAAGSQLDPELTGIFLSIPRTELESALTALHPQPAR